MKTKKILSRIFVSVGFIFGGLTIIGFITKLPSTLFFILMIVFYIVGFLLGDDKKEREGFPDSRERD